MSQNCPLTFTCNGRYMHTHYAHIHNKIKSNKERKEGRDGGREGRRKEKKLGKGQIQVIY